VFAYANELNGEERAESSSALATESEKANKASNERRIKIVKVLNPRKRENPLLVDRIYV
jgi:hypothetical protein